MGKQQPLSKERLNQLLALYGPVEFRMVGGYDSGVYFSFSGRLKSPLPSDGSRVVAGRIAGKFGFVSEAVLMTRSEMLRPGGADLEAFWKRADAKKAKFERWLEEYQDSNDG